MEGARRLRLLVVGSWTRVLITASFLVALWLVVAWLAVTGRLADARYWNVPLVHPYPPAGYVQNPFNPGDKGDLINVSEAARVKADLLRDGQIELRALELGDPSVLDGAATGKAREKLSELIAQNNTAGLFEREQVKLDSAVAGRLPDPNDPSITWMVEEHGTGTIYYLSKSGGTVVRQQTVRFTSRFWLLKLGDRYLITDALVATHSLVSQ
jgi:hypothetical protein